MGDLKEERRKVREARLRELGFEEVSNERRREQLERNVALFLLEYKWEI